VQSGRFASVDDAMAEAARLLLRTITQEPKPAPAKTAPSDPLLGIWRDAPEEIGTDVGRVALGIAPQGSHRSRRADFPHLARHVAGSLSLARSISLVVTRSEVRCPRRGSGLRSTTRRPLRSTGSGRARSPASTLL
jgi:hypothetical protein